MSYLIKEVSELAGISVRALHYYDEIGLLKPKSMSKAGYRLYDNRDLEKLQQILFFKELDFSLEDIKKILNSPSFNRKETLFSHRQLLTKRVNRLNDIINSIDKTIESIEGGINMDKKEMFNGFDMSEILGHQEKYKEEVKAKYGHSNAFMESQRKTSKYSKDDWAAVMGKADEIFKRLASLSELDPSALEVQEAISEWRQHITDSFYSCSIEIFRGLGEMYVNDERFTQNIDKYKLGLAEFMKKAIDIYCTNIEKSSKI